jgi:uncharacterized membrane protein YqjE
MPGSRRVLNALRTRTLLWILSTIGLNVLAFWIVVGPWYPPNKLLLSLTMAFFGLASIGGLWMLYTAVRHEKRPLAFALLSFVPFSFLWYYFERTRQAART